MVGSGGAPTDPNDPERQAELALDAARRHLAAGNDAMATSMAITGLQSARSAETVRDLTIVLSISSRARREWSAARHYSSWLAEHHPRWGPGLVEHALVTRGRGRIAESDVLFRKALAADPTNELALIHEATQALAQRRYPAVAAVADRLDTADPHGVAAPLIRAEMELDASGWAAFGRTSMTDAVIMTVCTLGAAFVYYTAMWIWRRARAWPHLRRARRHLDEALRRAPFVPWTYVLASLVAEAQLRPVRANRLATFATFLDHRVIDSRAFIAMRVRRLTVAMTVAVPLWVAGVAVAEINLAEPDRVPALGAALGTVIGFAVLAYRAALLSELPAGVVTAIRSVAGPTIGLTVGTVWTTLGAIGDEQSADTVYRSATHMVVGPLLALTVVAWASVLQAKLRRRAELRS